MSGLAAAGAQAQPFGLQPAKKLSNQEWRISILHKPDRQTRFDYTLDLSGRGAQIKFGTSKNRYDLLSIPASGTFTTFTPSQVGLAPGRYYARITNSDAVTTSGMQADTRPDLAISNEIVFIVENQSAPKVLAPRGTITNGTPTFEWTPVQGVVAYWVLFSSTPFEIVDEEVKGANLVWQYITNQTTALYGSVNENLGNQSEAPPLDPGREYSFTVLNLYDEVSPAFASPVFGGVIPMVFESENAIPKTELIEPANGTFINGDESITFRWTDVEEAANYTFNLYEVITQQGVDATVPIYSTTTTNTVLDYPALSNLKDSEYIWNVVSNDGKGGGTTSGTAENPNNSFDYNVPSGSFRAGAITTVDRSSITGVDITARAISGGVTPLNPFFLQATTISENLVAGRYRFTAAKDGYGDAVRDVEIRDGQETYIQFEMTPLPSFYAGIVVDENGAPVTAATGTMRNTTTSQVSEVTTGTDGRFGFTLQPGTYEFSISRPGFISPPSEIIRMAIDEQKEAAAPIVLQNDRAELSGYVLTTEGEPIQLAKVSVLAADGTGLQETRTNGNGFFNFTIASGNWVLRSEKSGFVLSSPLRLTASVGDNLDNQNITMAGRANQVTGFVREVIQNEDGTTGFAPLEDVVLTATPIVGAIVTTTSTNSGQFTLNLKNGKYVITASADGYTPSAPLDLVLGYGETLSGFNFRMTPNPSSLSGVARLADGTLLRDVTITVQGVGDQVTSSDGAFRISVPAGRHQVSARRSGYISSDPQTVIVNVGQNLSGINFSLSPNAAVVSGTVTSRGQTIPGVRVTATSVALGDVLTATTNEFGEYRFSLRPGAYEFSYSKSGFRQPDPTRLTFSAGQNVSGLSTVLTDNTVRVSGSVLSGGEPLRDVLIRATSATRPTFSEATRTLVNGTFELRLEEGHVYDIRAERVGYRTAVAKTASLLAGTTPPLLTLSVAPTPSLIDGSVRDDAGRPLQGVTLTLRNSGGELIDDVTSSENGSYTLGAVSGQYTLTPAQPGYSASSRTLTISPGQNLSGVNFTLQQNFARLSGIVNDDLGVPVANAFVSAESADGAAGGAAVTSESGSYVIGGLTTNSYTLSVSSDGFGEFVINGLSIVDGQQITQNPVLIPSSGTIAGVVEDVTGSIVPSATVIAVGEGGAKTQTVSGSDGSYAFEELAIEAYLIVAFKNGYTTGEPESVTLTGDAPSVVDATFSNLTQNIGEISVSVTSNSGAALAGARFQVSGPSGTASAVTDNAGSLRLRNLPIGTYTYSVEASGYSSDKGEISLTVPDPSATISVILIENLGILTGRVVDQAGNALPSTIQVRLWNDASEFSVSTGSVGNFRFDGLQLGTAYSIATIATGSGYTDAESSLTYPEGVQEYALEEPLVVNYDNNTLRGNIGTGNVSIKLIEVDTGELYDSKVSDPSGAFLFQFVPAGDYYAVPTKQGFIFNPDTVLVENLSYAENRTITFNVTENVGNIQVTTQVQGNGEPPVGSVRVVSVDNTFAQSITTDSTGSALFRRLAAGKDYIVVATKPGYSTSPESRTVSVSAGGTAQASFTYAANNVSVSGLVRRSDTQAALVGATVTLTNSATGATRSVSSGSGGAFVFEGVAAGTYDVSAAATGFRGAAQSDVVLTPGQNVSGLELSLDPSSVGRIYGDVKFKGQSLPGVRVSLAGLRSSSLTTNSSGFFDFFNVPILIGESDTTNVSLSIQLGNYQSSQLLKIPASAAGTTIRIPTLIIPSGQLTGIVTDGVNVVGDASISVTTSAGVSLGTVEADAQGAFATAENLRKGDYLLTVSAPGVMLPISSRRVTLQSDEDKSDVLFRLPYTFVENDSVLAGTPTTFVVPYSSGYDASGATGTLFYRKASESVFSTVPFSVSGGSLVAEMPAPQSVEQLVYRIEVDDDLLPEPVSSPEVTVTPLPVDIISRISLSPSPGALTLRAGDSYEFSIGIRDGVNRSMLDRFTGSQPAASITITTPTQSITPTVADGRVTFTYQTPNSTGVVPLTFTASYQNQVFTSRINLNVEQVELAAITISRPGRRIPNNAQSNFGYKAVDADGNQVLLGSSITWSIESLSSSAAKSSGFRKGDGDAEVVRIPSSLYKAVNTGPGQISSRGVFTPLADGVGEFKVAVYDAVSTIVAQSEPVVLFSRIETPRDLTIRDGQGFEMFLPASSYQANAEFTLTYAKTEAAKKYVVAKGTDKSLVVSDEIYNVNYSGSEIGSGINVKIPEPEGLELSEGERYLGYFNPFDLQWELQSTSLSGGALEARSVTGIGQYASMVENLPLGIDRLSILPNPFSPLVAPVKIGYVLNTDAPPAFVTIRIFNMRGQLVRTLVDEDPQLPGIYGGAASLKEITWDGMTDSGNMAANGRYILQVKARDSRNEVEQLKSIILVK